MAEQRFCKAKVCGFKSRPRLTSKSANAPISIGAFAFPAYFCYAFARTDLSFLEDTLMFGRLFGKNKELEDLHIAFLECLGRHLAKEFGEEGVVPHLTAESDVSRKGYKLLVVLGWNPE